MSPDDSQPPAAPSSSGSGKESEQVPRRRCSQLRTQLLQRAANALYHLCARGGVWVSSCLSHAEGVLPISVGGVTLEQHPSGGLGIYDTYTYIPYTAQ